MLRRRTWSRLCTVSRLATTWLLLVAYAGAALGVPLPMPSVAVDRNSSTPYPCQHGRCGCRTAEQCWKSCCCHSPRERLAWAEAHGVTPPSYVVATVEREARSPQPRSCCSHRHNERESASAETKVATPPAGTVWISSLDLARCRGTAPEWNNVPISLPASAPASMPAFEPCVRSLSAIASAAPLCPWFTPPDPPPWMG